MDKQKLITWMGYIEAALCSPTRDTRDSALKSATVARLDFTQDAACASVTAPPDTPPPSPWPSVSRIEREVIARTAPRIRKETRAEVVAEIVTHLRAEADKREQSVTTSSHQQMVYWFREAAAEIRARFG